MRIFVEPSDLYVEELWGNFVRLKEVMNSNWVDTQIYKDAKTQYDRLQEVRETYNRQGKTQTWAKNKADEVMNSFLA